MRKIALTLMLMLLPALASQAASEGGDLMNPEVDPGDTASLQRGAKLFASYCMGCHSLKYLRFNRLAQDLNVPEEVVEKYLIWDDRTIQSPMTNAMRSEDAKEWFGAAPPDLSLIARRRGAAWVYTYLNTFYRDDSQSTGFNNIMLPGASMPHVLWRLQGIPEPVHAEGGEGGEGSGNGHVVGVKLPEDSAGVMSPREYHEATRDIVNFLAYAAEPIRAKRQSMGIWVILFLVVFLGVAYMLKREYWKDVH